MTQPTKPQLRYYYEWDSRADRQVYNVYDRQISSTIPIAVTETEHYANLIVDGLVATQITIRDWLFGGDK